MNLEDRSSMQLATGSFNDDEMRAMLIEYMGKGFLENIIAMIKQDAAMARFIPDLLGDDAIVVRLGATALVEDLVKEHRPALVGAMPGLLALLERMNPTIRGDAANVLGIIGDPSARDALRKLQKDANPAVREVAEDALREIERNKA
jgi:HEAT repeat protein